MSSELSKVPTLDLNKFNKQIQEISVNIQKGKFAPCKGRYCDWCDYKSLVCPAWEDN